MKHTTLIAALLLTLWQLDAQAQTGPANTATRDLSELSLESLMDIEVTSVSKQKEAVADVAAAIFVLTGEDIHRSGATSIPEVLRLVPGLHVARIDTNRWAISARGANGLFANSLLVLIDGRSVYTPLFSGVYWDAQDTMLEDIERIEVIRGPGATMWGSNAVNGVINIITKSSKDTTGSLVSVGGGNDDHVVASFRHGLKLNDEQFIKIYGKVADRGNSQGLGDNSDFDYWRSGQGGFRFDSSSANSSFKLQGDIYRGRDGISANLPMLDAPYIEHSESTTEYSGGNILGRWTHEFQDDSSLAIQLYYDEADRQDIFLKSRYTTLDSDLQYQFALGSRHNMIVGGGFRSIQEDLDSRTAHFQDGEEWRDLVNFFAQDEVSLIPETLKLTLGAKIEHNDYTGSEFQPRVALTYTPEKRHTIWASFAQASRIPSRAEHDINLTLSTFPGESDLPVEVSLMGNSELPAERLTAYDIGYRAQLSDQLSIDTNLFYNDLASNFAYVQGEPYFSSDVLPHVVSPISFQDIGSAQVYGGGVTANWRPFESWQLQAWYTHWELNSFRTSSEDENPHNQFSLKSTLQLSKNIDFYTHLRFVDSIPAYSVDPYTELNVRWAWHIKSDIELSLSGINLLHPKHMEYAPNVVGIVPSEIGRAVFAALRVEF
ncbi:MAG: TonB-dependent receptor [Oligoflexia bacterium]|nr:TonB-dependent receptor [Oligoflexia bacterium]